MFPKSLRGPLQRMAAIIQPHLSKLDKRFARQHKSMDGLQRQAFLRITPGAAVRKLSGGGSLADFFEQVFYNGRRLAKLNVSPADVARAIRDYGRLMRPLIPAGLLATQERLYFCSVLAVNHAYYEVREAETQAFYGLLRAEWDATGLDDLLRRFIVILTRTFHAQSGRLIPFLEQPPLSKRTLQRLARTRYIPAGSRNEELIVDTAMRGAHESYWSIPFFSSGDLAGLIQFGFPTAYRWLPRELDLLNGFAERCLRAAERTRMIQDLAKREEEVRALAGHLIQVEENERRRISREVHDEAGQSLLFLRLQLEMIEKAAPPALRGKLADARQVAERIIGELRRIIAALSPLVIEQMGLAAAIRHLSSRFRKLHRVRLTARLSGYRGPLPLETESAIYRVVQECLQNIAKHARACGVKLRLRSSDNRVRLDVEDDGVGFDVDAGVAQPRSFGLKGIRERVALVGGSLTIRSRPGRGTLITVKLPVHAPAQRSSPGDEHEYVTNSNTADGRSYVIPSGHQDTALG